MTNTAVHRIRQKIPSLLVIARCPSDSEKMINTQRNRPMCIDIFLNRRSRPAGSGPRHRPVTDSSDLFASG